MSANDELLSAAIRHAVHNARYGRGLALKVNKLLTQADADMVGNLMERLNRVVDAGPATTKRLSDMIEAMRFLNDTVYAEMGSLLTTSMVDLAALETEFQTATIERSVAIDYRAKAPSPAFLKTLVDETPVDGYLLSSWTEAMSRNRLGRVEQALRIGLVQGETIDQLVRRIRGRKSAQFTDGVLAISRRSAETLAITATSTISNTARLATYRENSDLIKGVTFTATLDTRTSSRCQSHDGQFYAIDAPHPTPPLHPRCRSVLVPVTKSWQELGIKKSEADAGVRASMDGQVPASTSYGDWLKNQSQARQEEVLGVQRAELFRTGKLSFEDLYRDNGSYASIDELRRKLRA